MASLFWKTAGYTAAGIITAPIWLPLTLLGIASATSIQSAIRHPKITTGAMIACGALLYLSSPYGRTMRTEVRETIIHTVDNSQRQRNDTLERKLTVAMNETNRSLQQATSYSKQLQAAQLELAQYRRDREAYIVELTRYNTKYKTLEQQLQESKSRQENKTGTEGGEALVARR